MAKRECCHWIISLWIHCILPLQRQKLITWMCMWKQYSLPPSLTEPGPVQDRWVPPLWYKATLFHCLSNSYPLQLMFQRRKVLTGCRCTHIMEVMFRIPTPMPTNNQDASRDERQVLLIKTAVCNEHRKILFSACFYWQRQESTPELGKSSSLSELAEVWSCMKIKMVQHKARIPGSLNTFREPS